MEPTAQQHENLRRLRSIPLAIVCGREREARQISDSLRLSWRGFLRGDDVAEVYNGYIFRIGKMRLKSGDQLSFYITSSPNQGLQSFATQVAILFSVLRPIYAIHAGVCAGLASAGVSLGCVVFGETAINYEEGKWQLEDGTLTFSPIYEVSKMDGEKMESFVKAQDRPDEIMYGDFVSGCSVRTDAEYILDRVRSQVARGAIALDMEASAFLKVCEYSSVKPLGIIKGVSDHGNQSKDDRCYDIALENTATWIRYWLLDTITSVSEEMKPVSQSLLPRSTISCQKDDFVLTLGSELTTLRQKLNQQEAENRLNIFRLEKYYELWMKEVGDLRIREEKAVSVSSEKDRIISALNAELDTLRRRSNHQGEENRLQLTQLEEDNQLAIKWGEDLRAPEKDLVSAEN